MTQNAQRAIRIAKDGERPHTPFGIGVKQLLGAGELGPSPPTEQTVNREISLDVVDEEQIGDCQPQFLGRPVKARKKGTKGAKSVAAQVSPLSHKLPKPPFLAIRCARSDSYLIYTGQAGCFL